MDIIKKFECLKINSSFEEDSFYITKKGHICYKTETAYYGTLILISLVENKNIYNEHKVIFFFLLNDQYSTA